MKNTQLFINFFNLVQKELPHGMNPDFQIPVLIGKNRLTTIIFKIENGTVRFALFLGRQKYSRKDLSISSIGLLLEEEETEIPRDDLTKQEPDFSGITNESIAVIVATETIDVLTHKKIFVDPAQYPGSESMSSMGKASGMLIRQYQFPFVFEDNKDKMIVNYLDRLQQHDEDHIKKCFKKYGASAWTISNKFESMKVEELFMLLCELNKQDKTDWTGFRILGTVGSNGHPYYCLQLFYKHPESATLLYSENDSPNVLPRKEVLQA